jgi:hypothetical protein
MPCELLEAEVDAEFEVRLSAIGLLLFQGESHPVLHGCYGEILGWLRKNHRFAEFSMKGSAKKALEGEIAR